MCLRSTFVANVAHHVAIIRSLASSNIRSWRGSQAVMLRNGRPQFESHCWIFKDTWGHFQSCVGTKTGYFWRNVGLSSSVIVATEKVNSSQTMMCIFMAKPNQSISTMLWQERNRKIKEIKVASLRNVQLTCDFSGTFLAHFYSGDFCCMLPGLKYPKTKKKILY